MKNYLALITQKRALIIVVLIIIAGSVVASITKKEEAEVEEEPRVKTVTIETIQKQDTVTSELVVSGTAVPREFSSIRSLTQGTVEFLVPVGIDVIRGQSLFSIRDANVENAYYTSLEQLNSTQASTDQRVIQAELGVTSKVASYSFAEKSLAITKEQADQNLEASFNNAVVSYNSGYNTLSQVITSLSSGLITDSNLDSYIYKDTPTTNSELRNIAQTQFTKAASGFLILPKQTNNQEVEVDLVALYDVLANAKHVSDTTVLILQNTVAVDVSSDLVTQKANQTLINTAIASINTNKNALSTTMTNNRLTVQRDENRLELAQIELDNAKSSLETSRASSATELSATQSRFDISSYNFSNLTLSSPFSGTVLAHNVNPGEQVTVGQELIEIGNLDIIEIKVDVDASFANALQVRDPVVINENIPGFIAEIEPVADLRSGKVGIIVQSREGVLISGDIAEVLFDLIFETPDSIIIPIKAATIEEVKTVVFVEVNGKAEERVVTLGEIYGDKVSVNSGLSEDDRLIIPNGTFISKGDTVVAPTQ